MKPYTHYVCPEDKTDGYGHGSTWTGAMKGGKTTGLCICGAAYVEKIEDGLHVLTWEMITPGTDWHPVKKEHRTLRDAEQQRDGLIQLIAEGEPIRSVELRSYTLIERGVGAAHNDGNFIDG